MKTLYPIISIICTFLLSFNINAQSKIGSFMYNGVLRDYIVYKPTVNDGTKKVPLVLNLHGYTSYASQQQAYSEFDKVADTANFIVVYPNGIANSWNSGWNVPYNSGTDDVGFLTALIDTLKSYYLIDENRIYSTGMSNGGFMSFRLACELDDKIAAIASVTGLMSTGQTQNCNPTRKVPVMFIHGTSDPSVAYSGSILSISADSTLEYWKAKNGCNSFYVYTAVPNTNITDGCTAERFLYNMCDDKSEVEFIKITNGGHTWPGASIIAGITNQDFSGSGEIWKFFSKHKLNSTTTSIADVEQHKVVVFPNPASTFITIDSKGNNFSYQVVNNIGKVVLAGISSKNNEQLDVSELSNGIYFLTISSNASFFSQKIVLNK